MLGALKIIQKRPSDTTIRVYRLILGLLIIAGGYYNLIIQDGSIETTILWMDTTFLGVYIEYIIIALGIFPLFLGISNMCLLQKKHMKKTPTSFCFSFILCIKYNRRNSKSGLGYTSLFPCFFPSIGWNHRKIYSNTLLKV